MNLNDYIKMYELDFKDLPFNDIDALILTEFVYASLELVEKIDYEKEFYFKDILNPITDIGSLFENIFIKQSNVEMFRLLLTSKRYNRIKMKYYTSVYDKESEVQFSALTYFIEDKILVTYRGTDLSVAGWVEDFKMTKEIVEAQILAKEYLDEVIRTTNKLAYVSGHSKGGNLAVYAAMESKYQDKLIKIYDFDGPGFKDDVYLSTNFKNIEQKIFKIVPRTAIVGLLLNNNRNYKVVEAKAIGVMQHDPFTWEIRNKDFVYAIGVDLSSKLFNDLMNTTLEKFDEEKRQEIILNFAKIAENSGITSLKEVTSKWHKLTREVLKMMTNIPKERKDEYQSIIKNFVPKAYSEAVSNSKNKCINCRKPLETYYREDGVYFHCKACGKTYKEVEKKDL